MGTDMLLQIMCRSKVKTRPDALLSRTSRTENTTRESRPLARQVSIRMKSKEGNARDVDGHICFGGRIAGKRKHPPVGSTGCVPTTWREPGTMEYLYDSVRDATAAFARKGHAARPGRGTAYRSAHASEADTLAVKKAVRRAQSALGVIRGYNQRPASCELWRASCPLIQRLKKACASGFRDGAEAERRKVARDKAPARYGPSAPQAPPGGARAP
jgi:hypothetical protein